nr:MAG: hypothetical protein [Bacteriophage sp.]
MDDFKKVAVEFYKLALEEHAMLAITSLIGSEDAFKRFLDMANKVNEYLVQHEADFKKARLEVEANEMLNQEV